MTNKLMSKTFIWMFIGLLVTFLTGYVVSTNDRMLLNIFSGPIYIVLCIAELILVILLSARVRKMNKNVARIFFILYSFVSGLTFSSIFVIYQITSILYIFLIASVIFLVFGLIGYFTKLDLTKLGTYLLMGLFAIVICFIINIFINNDTFNLALTVVSLIIFIGFTAYDIQKLKRLSEIQSDIPEDNLSIINALNLYLDYINIFLDLLNLFGKARD